MEWKTQQRLTQVEKRQRKLIGMAEEMSGPQRYGPDEAEVTFVCWGSTHGPLREAVDRLNAERPDHANMLHFVDLWPFPTKATTMALKSAQRLIGVENNSTGQLATLIRANTGQAMDGTILRYDGRAFSPDYILTQVKEME